MSEYEQASARWIGKGSFGEVETIVRSWDQKTVVRKTVRFDPADKKALRNAQNEYSSQHYLDHPNIVRSIDVEWGDGYVRYYMDYFENGSLDTLISKGRAKTDNKVPQEEVWAIMYQLSAAVAYCHDPKKKLRDVEDDEGEGHGMKVLHRDIKPHNVLRASEAEKSLEELKLCDFGMSFIFKGTNKPETYAGTKAYKPPEISRAKEGGIEWTTKCDIYSLGCTLYEICNGEPPFPKGSPESESEAKKSTIQSYYDDSDLRDWIQRCLSFNPSHRPEAQEIFDTASNKLEGIPKYKRALGRQSLLEAVKEGSVEKVEEKLSHLQITDLQDGRSHTPLHRAVQYRKVNVVERLLKKGFSALARTEGDETPIHLALEPQDETSESKERLRSLTTILGLLVESCDINKLRSETYGPRQWTIVHLAAAANNVDVVKYVLENNGWIDSAKRPQWSLIHIAARMDHVDLLELLIERQKDGQEAVVEQESSDEATPLFAASKRGKANAVRLLLKARANINVRSNDIKIRAHESRRHVTPLHIAALGGHTDVVEILLDEKRNKSIKAKTSRDETALHLAVQNNLQSCQGVIDALEKIINIEEMATFTVDTVTKKRTALHMAVESGNFHGTLKLLEFGAKPDVGTEEHDTALHLAARKGLKAIAEALLHKGAQAGKANRAGATPLHIAIENSMHEDGQGRPTLDKAATETAEVLIKRDKKVVSKEAREGDIALHLAAKVGNFKLFEAAYRRNPALVNARKTNKETALHVAARADRHKIVEFLLHNDADRNLKDEKGRRALEVANGKSEAILERWG